MPWCVLGSFHEVASALATFALAMLCQSRQGRIIFFDQHTRVHVVHVWTTPRRQMLRMQLVFRTLNKDTEQPNHNLDYIAPLLRDQLMPIRHALTDNPYSYTVADVQSASSCRLLVQASSELALPLRCALVQGVTLPLH